MTNKATQSYLSAAVEFESIERLLLYFRVSNHRINENALVAVNLLKQFNDDLELPYDLGSKQEEEFLKISYYERTLSTMMFTRTIDNFETYFKDILSEVVAKDPRVLKSKETEQLDFILSFDNYESLVNAIAEKKIQSLFYQNIEHIQKFFADRLGVELFKEKAGQISQLIKQRNLAVHNRSKISKEFVKEFPDEGFHPNGYLDFNFEYVQKLVPALYKIVSEVDAELSAKYKLKEIAY